VEQKLRPPGDILDDDLTVLSDMYVLRRIPNQSGYIKEDGTPSSNNFDLDGKGRGTSVTLYISEKDYDITLAVKPEFGVVKLQVAEIRKSSLGIVKRPIADNPNHCEIIGPRNKSKKRALAKSCEWLKKPE
jgi:hypothetical protein